MEEEIKNYESDNPKYLFSQNFLKLFILLLTIIILIMIIGLCVISYYLSRVNKVICQSQCDSTFKSIINSISYYNDTKINYDYLNHLHNNCLTNCNHCDNSYGYIAFNNEKYCI